jgi:hypothetical protein
LLPAGLTGADHIADGRVAPARALDEPGIERGAVVANDAPPSREGKPPLGREISQRPERDTEVGGRLTWREPRRRDSRLVVLVHWSASSIIDMTLQAAQQVFAVAGSDSGYPNNEVTSGSIR